MAVRVPSKVNASLRRRVVRLDLVSTADVASRTYSSCSGANDSGWRRVCVLADSNKGSPSSNGLPSLIRTAMRERVRRKSRLCSAQAMA